MVVNRALWFAPTVLFVAATSWWLIWDRCGGHVVTLSSVASQSTYTHRARHQSFPRASPASLVHNVTQHVCKMRPPHPYGDLSPFLTVQLHQSVVYTSDPRQTAWPQRCCDMVQGLQRAVSSMPSSPGVVFAINPHDDCNPASRFPPGWPPITSLNYGVGAAGCELTAPLPWIPSDHNPKHKDVAPPRSTDFFKRIAAMHPWESKSPKAVWRGGATDGSKICKTNLYNNATCDRKFASLQQHWRGHLRNTEQREAWQRRGDRAARARAVLTSRLYPDTIDAHFTSRTALDLSDTGEDISLVLTNGGARCALVQTCIHFHAALVQTLHSHFCCVQPLQPHVYRQMSPCDHSMR